MEQPHTSKKAQAQYKTALHLFPTKSNGWTPQVGICSALEKQHIDQAWETIKAYRKWTHDRGALSKPTPRSKPLLVSSDDKSPFGR